jgi:hypothetical protein
MTAFLFILALLATLGQANPQRQAGARYRISGVVVDASTGVPIPRAQVSIFVGNEEIGTTASDAGQFAFEGLDAGKYRLYAAASGYLREAYGQQGAFLVAIATGNGQDSEHLVFRLHPQALIYGRVTDERGAAVRRAQVQLFTFHRSRASQRQYVQAQTQTNDLGEYRFAHLLPGKYSLAVQAQPWYAQAQLTLQPGYGGSFGEANIGIGSRRSIVFSGASVGPDPLLDVVYPITFFPSVTDERSSTELVLSAGDKQEANITLQSVPAIHLRVKTLPADTGTSFGIGASQRAFGTMSFGLSAVSGQVSPDEYEVAGLPRSHNE